MTGVITDMDGNFEIVAPYSKATLVFSYVGYQPKEVSLKGERIVNVKMVEDAKALEEVVVVGYTTQRKATITGSVATITTKDLKQSPTANLDVYKRQMLHWAAWLLISNGQKRRM